jgi:hypothetical protein
LLPGQNRSSELSGALAGNADGAPGWLAALDRGAARSVEHAPIPVTVVLAVAMAAIGLLALRPAAFRGVAAFAGGALAVTFWVVGQNLGELYTGQSTDPDAGPLIVLMAVCIAGGIAQRDRRSDRDEARLDHIDARRESLPVAG